MECKKIKIWLSDYLNDELDGSTKAKVEAHLEDCSECRQALDDLMYYQSVLQQVNTIKSPDGLREKIVEQVDRKEPKIHLSFTQSTFYRIGRIAAAAVLILAIILIPAINSTVEMEITYSMKVVKKGKGPPGEKRETAEVRLIREMAELSNGELVHVESNDRTGLVDYVEIIVSRSEYGDFAMRYNQEDMFEILPPEVPEGLRKKINIKIYYPGRRFLTGDFNGDGRNDILSHYYRGEHHGKWFISQNCVDSFAAPNQIIVHEDIPHVPIPNQLIAGDFNGDGYDDLVVGFYKNTNTTDWSLVFNDKRDSFSDRHDLILGSDSILSMGHFHAYAADINGDRADDFVVHFLEGDLFDQWWCFINIGDLSFDKPINLPNANMSDTLAGLSKVFFMDYNGDQRDDMLVYWKRKHDPEWWLYLNQKNIQTGAPMVITQAYQGAYYPYILDFDGDGYDEMIIKEGPEDMHGGWHLWKNEEGAAFRGDRQINFGGQDNFLVD